MIHLRPLQLRGQFINSHETRVFYPWVMYLLTVRITEAFGLPKSSLFCNVQRDVASLPSYSKLNSKCDS